MYLLLIIVLYLNTYSRALEGINEGSMMFKVREKKKNKEKLFIPNTIMLGKASYQGSLNDVFLIYLILGEKRF